MAQRTPSPEKLQQIHDLAAQWGKIVARRFFGADGPDDSVDLSAMEQVAQAAAAGLTEGTLDALLGQRAQALGDQQPCPACGQLCPVEFEDRDLAVQGGQLTLHEPVCYCPDCERDFFPPADQSAPGQPPLQPPALAEDR